MFTGIIRKTARVKTVEKSPTGIVLRVENPKFRARKGDSIAVNGVCSTVVQAGVILEFQYMPETIVRSAVSLFRAGDLVNLEESLRLSDRLDGHIVTGHIDTVGEIIAITREGNSKVWTISPRLPRRFMRLVAEKGSVALDGVSLTVVSVAANDFTVKIIPYTLEHTAFKERSVGRAVNLEFDILAKYLERLCK